MKTLTLTEFSDKTALLPWLIAETVVLSSTSSLEDCEYFINTCDRRMLAHYNTDSNFRKKLDGKHSREFAYSFIGHWFDSYIKNPEMYKKKFLNVLSEEKRKKHPVKVRATKFRGQNGFLVYGGKGWCGGVFGLSIFVDTKEKADLIKKSHNSTKDSQEIISGIMEGKIFEIG